MNGEKVRGKLNFLTNIIDKIKGFKIKNIIVVILAIVVIFILMSSFKDKKTNETTNTQLISSSNSSALEYCEEVENKLINVLNSIKGINNVKVYVSVSEGPRIKYLEEINSNKTIEGDKITESNQSSIFEQKIDGDIKPIMVVETLPEIKGVLIIAKGADIRMQSTLANIVSSVLSVSVSKVEVMEGK